MKHRTFDVTRFALRSVALAALGALAGAAAGLIAASLAGWPAALVLLAGLAAMRRYRKQGDTT